MNWNVLKALQSQLPRAVLPEQTPLADVQLDHLDAPIARLVHDRPLGRARESPHWSHGPRARAASTQSAGLAVIRKSTGGKLGVPLGSKIRKFG